ncbi:hypothetical protein DPMN_148666 [Dreissena polymorpha]|uniref:Uncharacterized protein n=1 Tax=Dreissena polymorpha TaxID=45954 RepID=A0A9D4FEH2_DREPO|nr:hypothetical protein DPMN_148666 [Dreissena polymorpha]
MSISLDAPPGMDRAVEHPYLEIGRDTYQPPLRKKKNRDVLNPIAESSMILDFKHRSWPSRGIDTLENTDPFTEMDNGMLDNGAVVPISPAGSKAVSRKSQRQKSFTFGEITPYGEIKSPIRPYMNGDVKKPYPAIMDRAMSPETAMEVRTLKSEKSFHSVRAKSEHGKSVRAPSVRAPSVRAPSVRAPSVKALSVRAPSEKGPGDKGPSFASVKRSKTPGSHVRRVKTPGVRSSKVGTAVPRLQRAATSTKIGSITTRRGAAPPSPRKKMTRSNTMTVDTRTYDSNNEGMANFLEGETNWGATSDAGKSQRSARTNRTSNTAKSNATSRASPRKSILKKTSQRMSSADILTDDEKDNRETGDLSAYQFPLAKSSLQDQYEAMLRRNDPMANVKKVKKAHRNPWH